MKVRSAMPLFVALVVIMIPAAIWMAYCAPCSWFAGHPVTDVPLRCLPIGGAK